MSDSTHQTLQKLKKLKEFLELEKKRLQHKLDSEKNQIESEEDEI